MLCFERDPPATPPRCGCMGNEGTAPKGVLYHITTFIFIPRNAVVYLAEDLHWREDLVSEVVVAIKEFTGHQRVKAGYSYMAGSPTLGYA